MPVKPSKMGIRYLLEQVEQLEIIFKQVEQKLETTFDGFPAS